jgi:hypothetical protein
MVFVRPAGSSVNPRKENAMRRLNDWASSFALVLALLVSLGFAGMALAEEAEEAATTPEVGEPAYVPVTFAGMKVFVDAETGRLRPPTAEESRELAQRMQQYLGNHKAQAHTPNIAEDGTLSVVVGVDHLNFTVATVSTDGQLHTDCVNGQDKANEAVEAASIRDEAKNEEVQ